MSGNPLERLFFANQALVDHIHGNLTAAGPVRFPDRHWSINNRLCSISELKILNVFVVVL